MKFYFIGDFDYYMKPLSFHKNFLCIQLLYIFRKRSATSRTYKCSGDVQLNIINSHHLDNMEELPSIVLAIPFFSITIFYNNVLMIFNYSYMETRDRSIGYAKGLHQWLQKLLILYCLWSFLPIPMVMHWSVSPLSFRSSFLLNTNEDFNSHFSPEALHVTFNLPNWSRKRIKPNESRIHPIFQLHMI